ncbi:hypothetical protein [Falsiroseomonas sp. CW058]|uniref:hypothetical protein n=1 Tax=Falsiroseomonas sp. CW058 TaxID=3388664 RepID=UPI003D314127
MPLPPRTALPRRTALLLPALIAGCAALPAREEATLPLPVQRPRGPEPTPEIILAAQRAFVDPGRLAGNPAAAAEALWQLEYLAAVMGRGGPARDLDPRAAIPLRRGRAEARAALGLRADAPPQAAVDALHAAATALRSGDRARAAAALATLGAGGDAVDRLGRLPPLPAAREGTEAAWVALQRREPLFFRTHDVD